VRPRLHPRSPLRLTTSCGPRGVAAQQRLHDLKSIYGGAGSPDPTGALPYSTVSFASPRLASLAGSLVPAPVPPAGRRLVSAVPLSWPRARRGAAGACSTCWRSAEVRTGRGRQAEGLESLTERAGCQWLSGAARGGTGSGCRCCGRRSCSLWWRRSRSSRTALRAAAGPAGGRPSRRSRSCPASCPASCPRVRTSSTVSSTLLVIGWANNSSRPARAGAQRDGVVGQDARAPLQPALLTDRRHAACCANLASPARPSNLAGQRLDHGSNRLPCRRRVPRPPPWARADAYMS
jgi:hypothetical protein